jgi:hypothetical protein
VQTGGLLPACDLISTMKLSQFATLADTDVAPELDPAEAIVKSDTVGDPLDELVDVSSVHPDETPIAADVPTTTRLTARLFAAVEVIAGQVTGFAVLVLLDTPPIGEDATAPEYCKTWAVH